MKDILEQCTQALERLDTLIREEREYLSARRTDGLDQLLNAKLQALQDVERCETERRAIVTGAGFAADREGMQGYLRHRRDSELDTAWAALEDRLRLTHANNETNGVIINKSLEHVERTLALFQGDSGRDAGTYDPTGQRRPGRSSREISRA